MAAESLYAYARREGWREGLRVALLRVFAPIAIPVHRWIERRYHTETNLRLAKVAGTALWWQIKGDDYPFRDGEPRTADEVIDKLYDYADRSKPLARAE